MKFEYFPYSQLNTRQKENYNFQKVASILADHGFSTIRLSDDWEGADFLALHVDGCTTLRVQLKSRLHFKKVYENRKLWLCFLEDNGVYLFPHDEALKIVLNSKKCMHGTVSWEKQNEYSMKRVPTWLKQKIEKYFLLPRHTQG